MPKREELELPGAGLRKEEETGEKPVVGEGMTEEGRQERDKEFSEKLEALNKRIDMRQLMRGNADDLKAEREKLLEERREMLRGAAQERHEQAA